MLLADIRCYLQERGTTSLEDIAIHFDITADVAQFAVEYWIKKEKIAEIGASCGSSCGGCGSGKRYQWRDETIAIKFMPYAMG